MSNPDAKPSPKMFLVGFFDALFAALLSLLFPIRKKKRAQLAQL
jgi:hypothetical protein